MLGAIKKPKKTGILQAKRQAKREGAETRNTAYGKMTLNQKLARQIHGGKVYRKLMIQSEFKGA